MAFQISVHYNQLPVVYKVVRQEDDVYLLHLQSPEKNNGDGYIPQKLVIRKKGKLWVSDIEDYQELIALLTAEITSFATEETVEEDE